MKQRALLFALVLALSGGAHAQSNEELKGLLDRGTKADIIDVRHWEQFVESHIKGARSMPLRVVNDRAPEISKTGLVVFY